MEFKEKTARIEQKGNKFIQLLAFGYQLLAIEEMEN